MTHAAEPAPRSVGRDSVVVLAGRMTGVAASFGVSIVLTRFLPAADVGMYLLAYSVTFVLAAVGRLGFQQTVVRQVASALAAGDGRRARRSAWLTIEITIAFAGAIGLALWLAGADALANVFEAPGLAAAALAVGLWTFSESVRIVAAEGHRGFHDITSATMYGEGPRNLLVLLALLAALGTQWVTSSSGAISIAAATGFVMATIATATLLYHARPRPKTPLRHRDVFVDSLPLSFASIAAVVLAQADIVIVGALEDSESVAVYGVALRLATVVGVPALVLASVAAPRIARLHALGRISELEQLVRTVATIATIPVAAILIAFAAAGHGILRILFGPVYEDGWAPLVILSAGCVVTVAMGLSAVTLAMTGHQREVGMISLLSISLMVGGCYWAGILGGITLIASAAAAAVVIQNVLMLILCRRRLGIFTVAAVTPSQLKQAFASARSLFKVTE